MTTTKTREHGTRARYVHGPGPGSGPGCRCDRCTAANSEAASKRGRQILYGRWQPYVDAGPAREHLRALSAAGIGRRRVTELTGLSTGAVSRLLYGGPGGRAPTRRIRPETAAAILAIRPSADHLAPSAPVSSDGTRRRIQALVAIGWSQARIAAELDMTASNFSDMLRRGQVTAATARAVSKVYDRLWNRPPPEDDQRSRIAASRARNYARTRIWAPPLAWDDDQIDLPDGQPAEDWQRPARASHRSAELAEDAAELFRQDYTREQAAGRLGVSVSALAVALSHAQRAREMEYEAQRARFVQAAVSAAPQAGYEAEAG